MSMFYSIVFIHTVRILYFRRVLGAQQSYSSNSRRNGLSLIDLTTGKLQIDVKEGISRYQ